MYGEIHFQSLLTILRYIDKHRLRYEKERWEEVGEGTGEGISTLREHRSYVGGSGGDLSVLRTRRFVDLGTTHNAIYMSSSPSLLSLIILIGTDDADAFILLSFVHVYWLTGWCCWS